MNTPTTALQKTVTNVTVIRPNTISVMAVPMRDIKIGQEFQHPDNPDAIFVRLHQKTIVKPEKSTWAVCVLCNDPDNSLLGAAVCINDHQLVIPVKAITHAHYVKAAVIK
jgi:hypothetical protein